MLMASTNKIVQALRTAIRDVGTEGYEIELDASWPVARTGDMKPWHTGRPNHITGKSHVNVCVVDSTWESTEAYHLDRSEHVIAWVKNDHLGFTVRYTHNGISGRKYVPDFLVKLANGEMLVLEVKGQKSAESEAKRHAMEEWVSAVNESNKFGKWHTATSFAPNQVLEILERIANPFIK